MEPIEIFKKAEEGNRAEWEFQVLLGHESKDVGFLVKLDPPYWEKLTGGRMPPEHLIKKSFQFLLEKHGGAKYAIWRSFHLRQVQRHFPDYEQEIKKNKISLGIFGL